MLVDDSPTQHPRRAGSRHRRRDDRAPLEPGGVRDRGRHQRARLADAERTHRADPGAPAASPDRRPAVHTGARPTFATLTAMAEDMRTTLRQAAVAEPVTDELALGDAPRRRCPRVARTCATCCRGSSPSARSTTGGARSSRSWSSTARWSTSTTTCGSAPRSRGSRTSRPTAARCSSPTTRARCRPTPRASRRRSPRSTPPAPALHDDRALLQGVSRLQHADAEDRHRARAPGQRPPAALRRAPARARVPRGRQGDRRSSTATATGCGASAAAASSRRRCAPRCRSSRSR